MVKNCWLSLLLFSINLIAAMLANNNTLTLLCAFQSGFWLKTLMIQILNKSYKDIKNLENGINENNKY